MKKYTLIFILFFSFGNKDTHAQKLFSFDEMLNIALCKSVDCFEKAAISSGYHKAVPQSIPSNVKTLVMFNNTSNQENSLYNTLSWIVFNDKNGEHRYVDFSFINRDHYNAIMKLIIERGYHPIKSNTTKTAMLVLSTYFRKGNTGVQATLSSRMLNGKEIIVSDISMVIPCTPNWPNDE